MTEVRILVESVRVDTRHRKDLGDISGLAVSIKEQGLINAITITPDHRLLAGERRLAAYRMLDLQYIEARIVDTLDDAAAWLRIERDENTERKAMTPSELVALGRTLEAMERPKAAQRRASAPVNKRSGQLTGTEQRECGETRGVVAAALGLSATQYERAKRVVDASVTDPDPEVRAIAQEALADMDAGRVPISAAANRVRDRQATRTGPQQRTQIDSPSKQRRVISSAEAALAGICHGLRQIEDLHADITSEEAAQWVGSLSESRRVITVLITQLKERTNAQP